MGYSTHFESYGICAAMHASMSAVDVSVTLMIWSYFVQALQQMIEIYERFGEKYSVNYNTKKSMCMVYDQFVDRSVQLNDIINIMLNGSRLIWSNCVKRLGNYIKYDLSEYKEIRHKKADFIWRVNVLCIKYQDAVQEVKMHLLLSFLWFSSMEF